MIPWRTFLIMCFFFIFLVSFHILAFLCFGAYPCVHVNGPLPSDDITLISVWLTFPGCRTPALRIFWFDILGALGLRLLLWALFWFIPWTAPCVYNIEIHIHSSEQRLGETLYITHLEIMWHYHVISLRNETLEEVRLLHKWPWDALGGWARLWCSIPHGIGSYHFPRSLQWPGVQQPWICTIAKIFSFPEQADLQVIPT